MTDATLLAEPTTIQGMTGSGKTVTAKRRVEMMLDQGWHVCVIDPTGAWHGLRLEADGETPAYQVVIFGGRHGDIPIKPGDGAKIAEIIDHQRMSCIIDLSDMFDVDDQHDFMESFTKRIIGKPRYPFFFVIDEADEFCPQVAQTSMHHAVRKNMRWIARRGRLAGFNLTTITQRPASIDKDVTSMAQTMFFHQFVSAQDQGALKKLVSTAGKAETVKKIMDSISKLGVGERVCFSPRDDVLEIAKTQMIHTFDSSKAPEQGDKVVEPKMLADIDISAIVTALNPPEPDPEPEDDGLESSEGGKKSSTADLKAANERVDRLVQDHEAMLRRAEANGAQASCWHGIAVASAEAFAATMRAIAEDIDAAVIDGGEDAFHKMLARLGRPMPNDDGDRVQDLPSPPTPSPSPSRKAQTAAGGTADLSDLANGDALEPRYIETLEAIRDAAAYLRTDTPSRTVVAFFNGHITKNSGAFKNKVSRLSARGLLTYPVEGRVQLTAEGARIAGEGPILGPRNLQARILSKLTPRHVEILEAAIAAYPNGVSRGDLAEKMEMTANSGGFKNYLSFLKSRDLISYPEPGVIKAEEWLCRR